MLSYDPGTTANPSFLDPSTALGAAERFTGEGVFPSAVTMFNPAFGTDELVSIGEGGHLTLCFDDPILDDPSNPYGVDFIVFGNAFFVDLAFPDGKFGDPASMFSVGDSLVEVSADGINYFPLSVSVDNLFPTQGYEDTDPFDSFPGTKATNFRKPMDPSLTLSDFDGLTYAQALDLYDGSGGGTPVDIGPSGLPSVSYIRISVEEGAGVNTEIDAIVNVPEPASASFLILGAFLLHGTARKRRR